jgi:prepilin-type N-terminal cleavage/methylation domain-containing protein
MTTPRRSQAPSGFTLVELLVAMTVVAILVGMLAAAIIPVMSSAKRTAILMEMKQIEQSIENFKNHYGFYPPSFVNIRTNDLDGSANNDIQCANELLRYLKVISPNNREGVGAPGSRPIDLWWANVGTNINYGEGQDLVFWLSALSKNKQYPLTGNGTSWPNAYDDQTIERDVFYEFKSAQLEIDGAAATYMQEADVIAPFLYIDAKSYGSQPGPGGYDGYYVRNEVNASNPFNSYENPQSFQLISWGLDKLPFDPDNPPALPTRWALQDASGLQVLLATDKYASDNLCNFCDGMLERYLTGTFESSAVK